MTALLLDDDPLRPRPSPFSEFFWNGLARGQVLIQRCTVCDVWQFPPLPRCRRCRGDVVPTEVSGRGSIYAWIVTHYAFHPAVADDVPYVVATVELDEGPRLYARLVGIDPEDVVAGMRVQPVFSRRDGYVVLEYEPEGAR